MHIFWIVLFGMGLAIPLYAYFFYPYLLVIWSLVNRSSYRRDETHRPLVTLIISAYNEEGVIRQKLHNTLRLDYPRDRLEVIVASESSDGTDGIVREYEGEGIVLKAFPGRLGKSATLARVIPEARGEVLVFSDANSLYRPDALVKLVRHLADPAVGAVVGRLRYIKVAGTVGGLGETLYWAYDGLVRRMANRVRGLVPGINGSIFAIRKSHYFPLSVERGDDFELCTGVAILGSAVVADDEAIAEEVAGESTAQQFRRKVRLVRWNTVSALRLIQQAWTRKRWAIVVQLVSQRLLRYLVPVGLLLMIISSLFLADGSAFWLLLVSVQVWFYLAASVFLAGDRLGLRLPRICLVPSYFLMVNGAAAVGLISGLSRGQRAVWNKQR